MNPNNYCVIMAGGIGSRFWPLSRTSKPKQFIDILGTGQSLLQQTFVRFSKIMPEENIFIVTNELYSNIVREQLPQLNDYQVLLEPSRKNTAPCIAYSNFKISKMNPNANILVAPSDHLILNESEFLDQIIKGFDFVAESENLLTLGIKPSRPETGYGYIQIQDKNSPDHFKKVKTFTEKPNLEMARLFLDSGEFYWNSGIFLWSLKSIWKAFEKHLPEVHFLFKEHEKVFNSADEQQAIKQIYAACPSISIDYGIMEKAGNVHVLLSNFGWSDLGTWGSLYEQLDTDINKNAIKGKNVFPYNTKNCQVHVADDKVVYLNGLNDFIVVESDNMLMICERSREQEIKQFVEELKNKRGEESS